MIEARELGKCYHIYDRPQDRLWQTLWRGRRQLYREFWALRDVSLKIGPGESVGIIGRNGSGKSTLLQLIAGTLSPTCGNLSVNGRISALLELGSGFNPEFSGRENVFLNAALIGVPGVEVQSRMDEILAFADIGEFIERPIKTYSSGMVVRLAFAVSACLDPEILIVDEALAVGDAGFQFKCLQRLQQLTDAGTTLLFVSHDLSMVKSFCNQAIYLQHGTVKFTGSPDEAGEHYLEDTRAEQRRTHTRDPAGQVRRKPPLMNAGETAFGIDYGRIASVLFAGYQGSQKCINSGDRISVGICVEYDHRVKFPCIVLALMDQRHVVIGGRLSPILAPCPLGQKVRTECLTFTFDAKLGDGHYYITVVLEDRASETSSLLVEKRAAVLSFQVLPVGGREKILGLFDMGIEITTEPTSRSEWIG